MNGSDVKWLKEMFEQHNEDQQKYLDAKFEGLSVQIGNLADDVDDIEAVCTVGLDEIEDKVDENEKKTNKKIAYGMVAAVLISLSMWTIFGTDAIAIVLKALGSPLLP
jgi:hypothetical protein